jgi:hypothetical protein
MQEAFQTAWRHTKLLQRHSKLLRRWVHKVIHRSSTGISIGKEKPDTPTDVRQDERHRPDTSYKDLKRLADRKVARLRTARHLVYPYHPANTRHREPATAWLFWRRLMPIGGQRERIEENRQVRRDIREADAALRELKS